MVSRLEACKQSSGLCFLLFSLFNKGSKQGVPGCRLKVLLVDLVVLNVNLQKSEPSIALFLTIRYCCLLTFFFRLYFYMLMCLFNMKFAILKVGNNKHCEYCLSLVHAFFYCVVHAMFPFFNTLLILKGAVWLNF